MKYALFVFCVLLSLLSCTKKIEIADFELYDQSESFGKNSFAVIKKKYLTSLDIPSTDGITVSQFRAGEVFEVQETQIVETDSGQEFWIKINGGWVLSSDVQLYNSHDKAKTASQKLSN